MKPMNRLIFSIFGLLFVVSLVGGYALGDDQGEENLQARSEPTSDGGNYALVNGLNMYYEVHGADTGTPLVLLHGGLSTIEVDFGRILPIFAETRRVIGI